MHSAGVIGKEIKSDCVTRRERSPFYICLSTYRQDLPKSLHWIKSIQAWSILLTSLLSLRAGVCNSNCVLLVSTSGFGPRPHFPQANIVFQRPRTPTNFLGYTSLLWALISPTTLTRHQPHSSPSMCCYALQLQSIIRSWLDPQMSVFN